VPLSIEVSILADEKEDAAASGNVLVVDDTPQYRRVLERLLSRHGYHVATAADGEAALVEARRFRPDLILLDIHMPGVDGFETCRRLKADATTQPIPVVFISGIDDIAAKVQAFAAGGVDYLTKPFHDDEVLMRVATHLALCGLQQRLEERVRERTAALALANVRLEREIAERREAEERFRGVLESAPEAMIIVNVRREVVMVNTQAERLFGYRRGEMLGRPIEMLMPQRHRGAHVGLASTFLKTPRLRPMGDGRALFGRRRDGGEFPVEISLSPLTSPGGQLVIAAVRDISERQRTEAALRELAAHRDAVREEERKRIAGEIHDELGSLLTALKMDISLLRMQLPDDSPALERVGQMRELVERTIGMVRQVATQLRPAALNLGLVAALEWLVEDFGRRTGIACVLDTDTEVTLGDAQATAIFRIVQESLTNIARHAGAAHVEVTLGCAGGLLRLGVADDGRGFDAAAAGSKSFGLFGIRERVRALGGKAAVDSVPGGGTRVAIEIPLDLPSVTPASGDRS
jgi:PAS domain S-box-containing protein